MSFPTSVLALIYLPLLIGCISGLKNVNNLQQFIATERIEAEFYTSATYATIYDDCTQDSSIIYLGDLSIGTVLEYDQVDFGDGVQRVSLRVANVDSSSAVTIAMQISSYSGSPDPPFFTVPINSTGSDKCAFVTVDVPLDVFPSGRKYFYITIVSGEGGQLFLDWFQFNRTGDGDVIPATEIIQAEDFDYAEDMTINTNCTDVTTIVGTSYSWNQVEYYGVDFGAGVQSVSVRVYTSTSDTQNIYFKAGTSGNTFATVQLYKNVSGHCNFSEVSVDVTFTPTGVQNLIVETYGYYTYIDSFVFVGQEVKWNATDKMEAEDYTSANNTALFADCGDPSINYEGQLQTNSGLEFDGVDFGSGVQTVTLRVSNTYTESPLKIALQLGSSTNTPFVTVSVGQSGTGSCDFYTVTTFLDTRPSGLQKLFFTFPSTPGGYLNLDWFQFNHTVD